MTETTPLDADSIQRRVRRRQMLIFGVLLAGIATLNIFTTLSNKARDGISLLPWEPAIWEYSSVLVIGALIPALAWFNCRFLITGGRWWRTVPLHLLATVPFSVAHVAGMVALRKLAYAALGSSYEFGAPLSNWLYEYRKDIVAYWMILAGLYSFRTYRLWLEHRTVTTTPSAPADGGLERLMVRKLNREFILNVADIDRIEADGNYVSVHARGDVYPLRESLVTLERKLDRKRFARVHRGHIVNIDRIREIQPWDSGDYRIVLKDGSFVNFSRRYRSRLSQLFH
ncbi:MAG TPA: LytTR family DNA-binding domain-containing protein [Gammaproteobacteria bacterium]|nr:LytTR family DNA-binding domain-containing protein [Gammaproteobacteria bacterium]